MLKDLITLLFSFMRAQLLPHSRAHTSASGPSAAHAVTADPPTPWNERVAVAAAQVAGAGDLLRLLLWQPSAPPSRCSEDYDPQVGVAALGVKCGGKSLQRMCR